MPNIEAIIQSGSGNAWLLLPAAVVLGALHALEPGHSKSLMTAFIVAINGTARQAVLLGLSATVGHTIVVWALALAAWKLGDSGVLERAEPWLLLVGGLLLIGLAVRMLLTLGVGRTLLAGRYGHPHHDHGHDDDHSHDNGSEDAHAAAHEAEIKSRYSGGGPVSNGEVAWFGFTGGLMPCPSAFAVVLACLHQKAYALGIVMVAAFSIGLAITLVAVGVAAAWGADALRSRFSGFDRLAQSAPYVSAVAVFAIGSVVMLQGARALSLV